VNGDEVHPVHGYITRGDVTRLRRELEGGLNPNFTYRKTSGTLLMLAAFVGDTSIGRLLIAMGADVEWTDRTGANALSTAACAGNVSFVGMLLESGAALDVGLQERLERAEMEEERRVSILTMVQQERLRRGRLL
jgi:ankyrin repeat protein